MPRPRAFFGFGGSKLAELVLGATARLAELLRGSATASSSIDVDDRHLKDISDFMASFAVL